MSDQVSPLRLIDVRRTALALFRDWAFTGAALTSLALGVGALTAIVSIVNALWFRPLPGSATERTFLVVVPVGAQTEEGELLDSISYRRVAPLARLPMLEHAAFEYQPGDNLVEAAMRPRLRLQERLDELRVAAVNASYFADLGVNVVGPGFVAADDQRSADLAAVISDALWRRLGAPADLVGQALTTTGGPVRVVGIAPQDFSGLRFGEAPELWLSLGSLAHLAKIGVEFLPVTTYVTVRPSVSPATVETELRSLIHPGAALKPLRNVPFRVKAERTLERQSVLLKMVLMGAAAVLIVGCANLGGLWLVRLERQRRDRSVRMALGATRATVLGELFVEVLILAAAAVTVGAGCATIMTRLLGAQVLPVGVMVADLHPTLDARVLAMAAGSAVCAALVAAARSIPETRRVDLSVILSRSGAGAPASVREHQAIVAVHTGLSVALVIVAVHLAGIVIRASWLDRGYDTGSVIHVRLQPKLDLYFDERGNEDSARLMEHYRELLRRIQALPGVRTAEFGAPVSGVRSIPAVDVTTDNKTQVLPIAVAVGGSDLGNALGVRVVAGRGLLPTDLAYQKPRRVVIDSGLAARLWPDVSPLGRVMKVGRPSRTSSQQEAEVVGVIEPTRVAARADRESYLLLAVSPNNVEFLGITGTSIVVRTAGAPHTLVRAIRGEAAAVFQDPAALSVQTAREVIDRLLAGERLGALMFSCFAIVAAVLALAGLAGLSALAIERRRRAIAIQLALGADRWRIARSVVQVTLLPVAVGAFAGVGIAWLLSGLLSSTIPDYGHVSATTYVGSGAGTLLACMLVVLITLSRLRSIRPVDLLREA